MSRPEAEDGFNPKPGQPEEVLPMVRRILAPNPSPMTWRGTNTYLVGTRDIAVIDPGPASDPHLDAILAALRPGQKISHIFVTHSHLDHSPLAAPLQAATQAPILAFGPSDAGRSPIMEEIASSGLAGGGEGIDQGFACDQRLSHGEIITGDGWSLEALHTPGHIGNHLCFALGDTLFSGDHVMGWASSLVSPPDGDLTDFMSSCRLLLTRAWHQFLPGHGAPVRNPQERVEWLINHRLHRESEILSALSAGPACAATLAKAIYTDIPPALLPAATRNVFAHLIDLFQRQKVQTNSALGVETVFQLSL